MEEDPITPEEAHWLGARQDESEFMNIVLSMLTVISLGLIAYLLKQHILDWMMSIGEWFKGLS